MDSYAAEIWQETLQNESRQQMKDWIIRNPGQYNPLDFVTNPMPPGTFRSKADVSEAGVSIPRNSPVETKNPFQIRDPTFVVPRDPNRGPKFYAGRHTRRNSCELPGVTARKIPGINFGLGGAKALHKDEQEKVMQYPPPNPLAKKSQATPASLLPGSTTFGFGYNFHRAVRDGPPGIVHNFRPSNLPGERKLRDL